MYMDGKKTETKYMSAKTADAPITTGLQPNWLANADEIGPFL
jgi:hypothetical protein